MDDPVLAALERDESYRIVRVLAEKPSGRTELVVPPAGGPLLVRKRIPIALANVDAWALLAVISDPHLPRVIETYRLPDQFVVVCEYVEGESAADLIARFGALAPEQVLPIIEGVCTAAGVLHAYGIIHRDITPTNVIVRGGEAHLIDLGIARVGDMTARHDTTRLGTWGFAAPEQYGFAQTDARSDVYSIGCLAAFLLTGVRPDAEGFDDAVAVLAEPLRTCIDKARSFEPSARYASAAELSVAFADAVTDARSIAKRLLARAFPARGMTFMSAYRAAPTPRKALALLLPLPILIIMQAGIERVAGRWDGLDLFTKVGTALFALVYELFWVATAFNIARALVGAGGYAAEKHRVVRFLLNELLLFFAMIAALVVVSAPFGLR